MSALIAVYLALWSAIGGQIDIHQSSGPVRFVDLYGEQREAPAALACIPGLPPQLWIAPGADLGTLTHELAHAYDCLDDGLLNGSPSARPEARPAWAADYCWESDAEWYACSVVHTASTSTLAGTEPTEPTEQPVDERDSPEVDEAEGEAEPYALEPVEPESGQPGDDRIEDPTP